MVFLLIALSIFTVGCSSFAKEAKPDHEGVFAVSNGKLVEMQRLVKDQLNSRSGSGTFTTMPNVITADPNLYLIVYGGFGDALLQSVNESKGRYETKGDRLTIQEAPVKGEEIMDRLKPVPPLTQGFYELSVVGCSDNNFDSRCYIPFKIK